MDDFETELKVGFLEEATQLLTEVEQCFLTLESNPNDPAILDKIFRLAHNLKGSSKAVGFNELGMFTHEFESYLLKVKNGQIAIAPDVVSLLLKCNDHLRNFVDILKGDINAVVDSTELIGQLVNYTPGGSAAPNVAAATEEPKKEAEQKASEAGIDNSHIMGEITGENSELKAAAEAFAAEEKISNEMAQWTTQKVTESKTEPSVSAPQVQVAPVAAATPAPKKDEPKKAAAQDESIRVSLSRLEKLLNYVGEMVILQTVLKEQAYSNNPQTLRRTIHQLGKVTKEVQDISMGLRMVPLKQTFQKMQRIVRDTSGLLGKKVNLILEGEDTEVDKTVLENLGDPLVHLIRNAVDHGIESAEERKASGKGEAGNVTLRALHRGGKLVIEVVDDGGGINGPKLTKKAIEKGLFPPNTVMTEKEGIHLIFHPGFSTKAQVTEVSGRGVGMDVVKTNIESLQGDIAVETKIGTGTTFRITLPLTLAIIDGMIVKCGEERYVIPLSHVHESVKPKNGDIQKNTNVGEILMLRGENLPIHRLHSLLGRKPIDTKEKKKSDEIAVVVRTTGQPFAAIVDDIIGQYQVVVKKLGNEIQNIKGFSGSAILGDGKPALILEMGELVTRGKITKAA